MHLIKRFLFLFILFMPNLYSRLGSKYIEGILPVAPDSLIEGHWRICILLLFVIEFNPSNVYALLYGAPEYCEIYICPYLGYRIGAYVWLLILICFFCYALQSALSKIYWGSPVNISICYR